MADANTDLRCYLTNAGIAAENNSIQLSQSIKVTEMVFGSGLLPDESDPQAQTAMINEEYVVPCAMFFDEASPTLLVFKSDLPADVGGFHINEVGIRLEDGTIYGYARGKGDYKPTLEQGATDSVRYVVEMHTENADIVVAKIDLSTVYVDWEDFEAHKADEDPHTQYLLEKSDRLIFPNESQFNAMRERNRSKFAASDFVYHGKHSAVKVDVINEGLWKYTGVGSENKLYLGRDDRQSVSGESHTPYPVMHIAGVMADVVNINNTDRNQSSLLFPPAPDGTVTYDSATGVVTDFKKDAGHYAGVVGYETVAQRAAISGLSAQSEAVCSAFEGLIKNGDGRLGDIGWSVPNGVSLSRDNNDLVATVDISWVRASQKLLAAEEFNGKTVNISFDAYYVSDVEVNYHVVDFSNSPTGTPAVDVEYSRRVSLTPEKQRYEFSLTGGGLPLYINLSSQVVGTEIRISNIEIRFNTNQVVTERVDMTGLEPFQEEVTNGEVFPPCIQNTNSSVIAGVPMRLSSRPKSYFQVYDGQYPDNAVNNVFYCWYWPDLTPAQKAKVADYLKGTAFVNSAGNLVQWRIRNRSFAGAGNGDWSFSGQVGAPLWFDEQAKSCVSVKGVKNSSSDFVSSSGEWFQGWNTADSVKDNPKLTSNGVYQPRRGGNNAAYNGECYFYVIDTVPRLNQGAYHPSLNPLGARKWNETGNWSNANWTNPNVVAKDKKTAFLVTIGNPADSEDYGAFISSGKIGTNSGRPDGKFYDAIYASGLGGVIDHRLKYGAWDASSSEQAAVVREEVKSGVYRGREALLYTRIYAFTKNGGFYNGGGYWIGEGGNSYISDSFPYAQSNVGAALSGSDTAYDAAWIVRADTGEVQQVRRQHRESGYGLFNVTNNIPNGTQVYLVYQQRASHEIKPVIAVEGEFTQTDVIGNPANILQCDALKDGWLGSWIPDIPDGTSKRFALTRPNAGAASINRVYTLDYGSSWLAGVETVDSVKSDFGSSYAASAVSIVNYTVSAKQTKPSSNLPVLNDEDGVSKFVDVLNSSSINFGALLANSTIGLIVKGQFNSTTRQRLSLQELSFDNLGKLTPDNVNLLTQKHNSIGGLDSSNNTHAAKYLFHQINESEQANLNIIANELIYDASSFVPWGDDSTMKVVAASTFTDLNGNVCKSDIHKLSKPYGWIKNDI